MPPSPSYAAAGSTAPPGRHRGCALSFPWPAAYAPQPVATQPAPWEEEAEDGDAGPPSDGEEGEEAAPQRPQPQTQLRYSLEEMLERLTPVVRAALGPLFGSGDSSSPGELPPPSTAARQQLPCCLNPKCGLLKVSDVQCSLGAAGRQLELLCQCRRKYELVGGGHESHA